MKSEYFIGCDISQCRPDLSVYIVLELNQEGGWRIVDSGKLHSATLVELKYEVENIKKKWDAVAFDNPVAMLERLNKKRREEPQPTEQMLRYMKNPFSDKSKLF